MAGAGYKLFNTGDVLTAAQVNTYLMEQTVMVFANAAARTTALSGVVSEGMISYLKDTNAVEVYDGSNWVSSDDPNAIQNTIVDAKGDLIAASAADTPARLAVGNNGETLVADSSATTGLRWQGNYAAGKNAIINGDFRIWQRGTSFTTTNSYTSDRFLFDSDISSTISQQTFTPGTAPVAGYEGQFFCRVAKGAGGTYANFHQRIEDVRTFAGQTVTLSFWAKVSSGTFSLQPDLVQNFGSGGSASTDTYPTAQTITTSWARYSYTTTLPSVSGKTIGTSSFLGIYFGRFPTSSAVTMDFWGIQLELGNTATAFQTATGILGGELAACQRYYWRSDSGVAFANFGMAMCASTTAAYATIDLPVTMRIAPTTIDVPSTITRLKLTDIGSNNFTISAIVSEYSTKDTLSLKVTSTGLTLQNIVVLTDAGGNNSFIGASAEL